MWLSEPTRETPKVPRDHSMQPIMSLNFSMPSRSISPGSASTISYEA